MKNTLENKAKFFALYFGNSRAYNDDLNLRHVNEEYITSDIIRHPERIKNAYELLKPTSIISFEDAIECLKLMYSRGVSYYDYCKSQNYNEDQILNYFKANFFATNMRYREADYLRSKGYALPWMGLSVEKLIEYGWIKIKEN